MNTINKTTKQQDYDYTKLLDGQSINVHNNNHET